MATKPWLYAVLSQSTQGTQIQMKVGGVLSTQVETFKSLAGGVVSTVSARLEASAISTCGVNVKKSTSVATALAAYRSQNFASAESLNCSKNNIVSVRLSSQVRQKIQATMSESIWRGFYEYSSGEFVQLALRSTDLATVELLQEKVVPSLAIKETTRRQLGERLSTGSKLTRWEQQCLSVLERPAIPSDLMASFRTLFDTLEGSIGRVLRVRYGDTVFMRAQTEKWEHGQYVSVFPDSYQAWLETAETTPRKLTNLPVYHWGDNIFSVVFPATSETHESISGGKAFYIAFYWQKDGWQMVDRQLVVIVPDD